jgi:hypothetical protein
MFQKWSVVKRDIECTFVCIRPQFRHSPTRIGDNIAYAEVNLGLGFADLSLIFFAATK